MQMHKIAIKNIMSINEDRRSSPRSFIIVDELREDSDEKLFFLYRFNRNHVAHRLFPQPKNIGYNLRQRTHNLTLPADVNAVIKQNLADRMLFRDIY